MHGQRRHRECNERVAAVRQRDHFFGQKFPLGKLHHAAFSLAEFFDYLRRVLGDIQPGSSMLVTIVRCEIVDHREHGIAIVDMRWQGIVTSGDDQAAQRTRRP